MKALSKVIRKLSVAGRKNWDARDAVPSSRNRTRFPKGTAITCYRLITGIARDEDSPDTENFPDLTLDEREAGSNGV
jgi:hypothetical protein